mgnify:CR=1 FL=1
MKNILGNIKKVFGKKPAKTSTPSAGDGKGSLPIIYLCTTNLEKHKEYKLFFKDKYDV